MVSWIVARTYGGMAWRSFGHGVLVDAARKDHAAVDQTPKPVGEERFDPLELCTAELIDNDQQN
jgi:hypothetical protein